MRTYRHIPNGTRRESGKMGVGYSGELLRWLSWEFTRKLSMEMSVRAKAWERKGNRAPQSSARCSVRDSCEGAQQSKERGGSQGAQGTAPMHTQ